MARKLNVTKHDLMYKETIKDSILKLIVVFKAFDLTKAQSKNWYTST